MSAIRIEEMIKEECAVRKIKIVRIEQSTVESAPLWNIVVSRCGPVRRNILRLAIADRCRHMGANMYMVSNQQEV